MKRFLLDVAGPIIVVIVGLSIALLHWPIWVILPILIRILFFIRWLRIRSER